MIEVIPVTTRKLKRDFINFPYKLYRDDPYFVPPLRLQRREFFSPKKNPFFDNANVQLFVAKKDGRTVGRIVGRISAQINYLHNERYGEKRGHFGFFDAYEDRAIAAALFNAAGDWLKERGMARMVGPFNLSINEEAGVLVAGFDHSPYPFMPYNYPYYADLITAQGFEKIKELIAWHYDSRRPVPEAAQQIVDVVKGYPGLVVREVDRKNLERDVGIIADVFNSAWSQNWGFIPWTEAETKKMAKDFKMLLEPWIALIAEVDGKPAAIALAIPNYHEVIADLNGRLFPFGFVKFLYRIKTRKIKSARLALLGIKKEFRNDTLAGLSVYLYSLMHQGSKELGDWGGELSWTLEDNEKINTGIRLMGGRAYKRYRLYQKSLNE